MLESKNTALYRLASRASGNIELVFANQEHQEIKIAHQIQGHLAYMTNEISARKNLYPHATNMQSLKKLNQARVSNIASFKRYLTNFYRPLQKVIPARYQTYEELIFRDWCWQEQELLPYFEYLQNAKLTGNILFLGAGACRLSYDFAQKNPHCQVYAMDFNPFLIGQMSFRLDGNSIELIDASTQITEEDYNIYKYELGSLLPIDNHQLVMADFFENPFQDGSFDHIVGQWFFDILPAPMELSITQASKWLNNEGSIIYMGPSNRCAGPPHWRLNQKEILQVFTEIFSSVQKKNHYLPYLASGYEQRQYREQITFLQAQGPTLKKASHSQKAQQNTIEFNEKIEAKKIQTEVFYKIFKNLEYGMSYDLLAKRLESEFGMNKQEAIYYARNFIASLTDNT